MSSENKRNGGINFTGTSQSDGICFVGDHLCKHFHLIGLVLLNYMYMYLEHLKLFNTIIHRSANFKSQILCFLIKITSFQS